MNGGAIRHTVTTRQSKNHGAERIHKDGADGNVKAGVLNVVGGGIDGKAVHASATTQELSFSVPMVWKKR